MTPKQQDIYEMLKKIKPDYDVDPQVDTDLFDAGILDSMGMIEFISEIEKGFNIRIPDQDLIPQNFWSIEAIEKTISR